MKKVKNLLCALLLVASAAILAGCAVYASGNGGGGYTSITPEQAKKMMDESTGYVILDVRTQAEYDEGHLEGAILIPDYEVEQRAEAELPDKNQLIFVYCRSGRRSRNAAAELAALGYTSVYEIGGILNWPYETVK